MVTDNNGISRIKQDELLENEILALAQQGNAVAQEQIIRKYDYLVKRKGERYFLPGGEKEDLLQEGMIGLYQAMLGYRAERGLPFPAFAGMCIGRRMVDAVRRATAGNRMFPTEHISLAELQEKEQKGGYPVSTEQLRRNPEWMMMQKEYYQELQYYIRAHMTRLERMVLYRIALGYSLGETAGVISRSRKAVDNAMQRVREKMRKSPFHA